MGSEQFTEEQIRENPETFLAVCQDEAEGMNQKANEHWKNYWGFRRLSDTAEIQAIYAEALSKGKSKDWVDGMVEGKGLVMLEDQDSPWFKMVEKLRNLLP